MPTTNDSKPAAPKPDPASGHDVARRFGAILRKRREALAMQQDELALASGVGRRFIIDLEAGKPTCHLGKALLVAQTLGLPVFDMMAMSGAEDRPMLPDIPDDLPPDDLPEPGP